jgi:5'(3')-deoxyribonucleotidase
MKTQDIIDSGMPHLFLDMDGVQADFFGAWAALHSVRSYKEIADPEASIVKLANTGPDRVYTFFRNLHPLPGGQHLIQWIRSNEIPCTVLSAPLRIQGPASVRGKKDWLDEHFPGASANAIFTSGKHKYAMANGRANVLVDDFGKYLFSWEEAGGCAIKHEEGLQEKTIAELTKIYGQFKTIR